MPAFPLVLVVVAAVLGAVGPPARASCVGPELRAEQRGGEVVVSGEWFHAGCPDTMSCSALPGCDRCTVDDPAVPYEDVRVELRQGDRVVPLGEVDAEGPRHAIGVTASLPAGTTGTVVVAAVTPEGDVLSPPLRLGR